MANLKRRKNNKRRRIMSARAYWIGVGISSERHGDSDNVLKNSDSVIRASALRGYEDDNLHNVSALKQR